MTCVHSFSVHCEVVEMVPNNTQLYLWLFVPKLLPKIISNVVVQCRQYSIISCRDWCLNYLKMMSKTWWSRVVFHNKLSVIFQVQVVFDNRHKPLQQIFKQSVWQTTMKNFHKLAHVLTHTIIICVYFFMDTCNNLFLHTFTLLKTCFCIPAF